MKYTFGSTKALADATGTLTDSYAYDAYGEMIASAGSTPNNYKFAGEAYDSDLGMYYNRARYYNQSIGRFSQMDSWQGSATNPITLNKYVYANANPVMYTDPSGNMSLPMVLAPVANIARFSSISYPTASLAIKITAETLLTVGLAAGNEALINYIRKNEDELNKSLAKPRAKQEELVRAASKRRKVLFHYTSRASAMLIFSGAYIEPTDTKKVGVDLLVLMLQTYNLGIFHILKLVCQQNFMAEM